MTFYTTHEKKLNVTKFTYTLSAIAYRVKGINVIFLNNSFTLELKEKYYNASAAHQVKQLLNVTLVIASLSAYPFKGNPKA